VLDSANEAFDVWKDLNDDEALEDFQDAAQDFRLLPKPSR